MRGPRAGRWGGLCVIGALLLAGCADEDPQSESTLRSRAHDYLDAVRSGDDASAHDFLTERCQSRSDSALLAMAGSRILPSASVASVDVGPLRENATVHYANVTGDDATVTTSWRYESGAWRSDDCDSD